MVQAKKKKKKKKLPWNVVYRTHIYQNISSKLDANFVIRPRDKHTNRRTNSFLHAMDDVGLSDACSSTQMTVLCNIIYVEIRAVQLVMSVLERHKSYE